MSHDHINSAEVRAKLQHPVIDAEFYAGQNVNFFENTRVADQVGTYLDGRGMKACL